MQFRATGHAGLGDCEMGACIVKTYTIIRSTSGQVGCTVDPGNGCNRYLLKHCVVHSPTGFETGYGGSGPADLAVSILADFLGATPQRIDHVWRNALGYLKNKDAGHKALRLHQLFKSHFIVPRAIQPGQSYEISGAEIASWITEQSLA